MLGTRINTTDKDEPWLFSPSNLRGFDKETS